MNNALDSRVELMVNTIANFFSNFPHFHAELNKLSEKLGGETHLARLILIRAGMRPHTENDWYFGRFGAKGSVDVLDREGVVDALIADWAEGA